MEVTKEMLDFYEKRTNRHIDLVQKNLRRIAVLFSSNTLLYRTLNHDKSKFSKEEYIPYVLFSWHKKEPSFDFTQEMSDSFALAWKHHYENNDHHCEYWVPPQGRCPTLLIKNISQEAMIEMCCDVHAMSQEFGDDPVEFLKNNQFKKYPFPEENKLFMLNIMSFL